MTNRSLAAGLLTLCSIASLTGCMNMSGLSGGSSYACKAPEGVTCDSVSGTYATAIHNNLPGQRPLSAATGAAGKVGAAVSPTRAAAAAPVTPTVVSPIPLRSSSRILRLWFKPWEDADHDLYDQGHVYVQIDNGRWLIEHAQRQIREAYAPLRPPPKSASAGVGAGAAVNATGGQASTADQRSAPRPAAAVNPFPGPAPSPARPDDSD